MNFLFLVFKGKHILAISKLTPELPRCTFHSYNLSADTLLHVLQKINFNTVLLVFAKKDFASKLMNFFCQILLTNCTVHVFWSNMKISEFGKDCGMLLEMQIAKTKIAVKSTVWHGVFFNCPPGGAV